MPGGPRGPNSKVGSSMVRWGSKIRHFSVVKRQLKKKEKHPTKKKPCPLTQQQPTNNPTPKSLVFFCFFLHFEDPLSCQRWRGVKPWQLTNGPKPPFEAGANSLEEAVKEATFLWVTPNFFVLHLQSPFDCWGFGFLECRILFFFGWTDFFWVKHLFKLES